MPFQVDVRVVAIAVIMCMAIVFPVICSLKEEEGEEEETEEEMGKEEKGNHRENAVELAGGTGKEAEKKEEVEDNNHLYTE